MDRAPELVRRQTSAAADAFRFALDGVDAGTWGFTTAKAVPTVGWRVRHVLGCLTLYIDHGWFGGGASFEGFQQTIRDISPVDAVAEVGEQQARLVQVVEALSGDALDEMRPTHWGGELPAWQLVWTLCVEQLHHGAEIGVLLDTKRGGTRTDPFPELQDGSSLA